MWAVLRAPAVRTAIRVGLFLAGLGILVRLVIQLDLNEIVRLVARTGWQFLALLVIYAGCQAARAAALWLCQPQVEMVPYREVLAVRVSAEAVRVATFAGSLFAEPSKVWLLGRRGLKTNEGIAAIIAELVTHSVMACAVSIPALGYLISRFELSPFLHATVVVLIWAMGLYVLVAVVAVWFRVYLIGRGVRVLARIGLPKFERSEVRLMEDLLLRVLRERPARLALILACQAGANLFLMLEIFVALRAMEVGIPTHYAFVIEGSVKFIGVAFFFIPTQIGVSEGAMAILFTSLGLPAAAGVSLAFIRRLRTLGAAAVGLAAITVLGSGPVKRL
jgi:hypothetical protein